ncbi:helix-turn-helix domain-containing protein [Kitasatospora viridis]|uniref:Helix-turn-helix protein n=1 Tax=Kitasatospora viridis TaxID=281105 RepID=A0A561UBK2_9ACTN|nr:helix-turn-helix transcriptional regulator [Kitasatospora viridis]TWF96740.1 helix-turn-helix protein [Kitasatospora viridis]
MAELDAALRTIMRRHHLTVDQLTRRSGLGRTTVSKVLNGGPSSERTVLLLARALGADPVPLLRLRSRRVGPPPADGSLSAGAP